MVVFEILRAVNEPEMVVGGAILAVLLTLGLPLVIGAALGFVGSLLIVDHENPNRTAIIIGSAVGGAIVVWLFSLVFV